MLDIKADGFLTLMTEDGETKEDLKVEEPEVFFYKLSFSPKLDLNSKLAKN